MNFWIICVAYVVIVAGVLVVMAKGKTEGNSIFDKLYRVFCIHFPQTLLQIARLLFGERGSKFLVDCWDYVAWKNNPLVQLFYVGIITGAYGAYSTYVYPLIPNPYVPWWHKHTGFATVIFCLATWLVVSIKDPGIVTEWNVRSLCQYYGWTSPIFEKSECRTCKTLNPSRSKHCSLCDICVSRFDHHCIWVNNCVGVGNHRWFLLFLASHSFVCCYGAVLGLLCLWYIIKVKGLTTASFVDTQTQQQMAPSMYVIFQYLMSTDGPIVLLTALCVLMGFLTMGFLGWHMFLVSRNTTSNELSKWKFLKYIYETEGTLEENRDKLVNVYDRGSILKNCEEVFFPIDVNRVSLGSSPAMIDHEFAMKHKGKGNRSGRSTPTANGSRRNKKKAS